MSRICPITGKKPSTGHNVSHSQRKTKRTWSPNLVVKKILNRKTWKMKKTRVSTSAIRLVTKDLIARADQMFEKAMAKTK